MGAAEGSFNIGGHVVVGGWDWERFVVLILGNFYIIGGEDRRVLKIVMFGWYYLER